MSAATLKRRLNIEGTTYSEILDEVRRDLALRHLADRRLSIAKVALRLGFSNASAFGRAFKRWMGMTPIAYRKRAQWSSHKESDEMSEAFAADEK